MSDEAYYVVKEDEHDALINAAFIRLGYPTTKALDMVRICRDAALHGVKTHNAIKALHLDEILGTAVGGCVPDASIVEIPTGFQSVEVWDSNFSPGPTIGWKAIETCIKLADKYGIGTVTVNNGWHYLWGGGYVLEAARKGYIAYTNCTSMLTEVVPFGGRNPGLGTNPHSWAFPTYNSIGFNILVDWATSAIAMGRVQALKRDNKNLPINAAIDNDGNITIDPNKVFALLPFGEHKGFGLGLINEIFSSFIGGPLPSMRGQIGSDQKNFGVSSMFQVIHPKAINSKINRTPSDISEDIKKLFEDITCKENSNVVLPGQPEAKWLNKSIECGGLLFTKEEINAFSEISIICGLKPWSHSNYDSYTF